MYRDIAVGIRPTLPSPELTGFVRVAVVGASEILGQALSAVVNTEADLHAIAISVQEHDLGRALAQCNPDVVLLDVTGSDASTKSCLRQLEQLPESARSVLIVTQRNCALAAQLIGAGASSAILDSARADELISALRWTAGGASWISPTILGPVLSTISNSLNDASDSQLSTLTKREREVLQLMVDGFDLTSIAERLYISVNTARTHLRNISDKLGAHSATAAVSMALAAGFRPSS